MYYPLFYTFIIYNKSASPGQIKWGEKSRSSEQAKGKLQSSRGVTAGSIVGAGALLNSIDK